MDANSYIMNRDKILLISKSVYFQNFKFQFYMLMVNVLFISFLTGAGLPHKNQLTPSNVNQVSAIFFFGVFPYLTPANMELA